MNQPCCLLKKSLDKSWAIAYTVALLKTGARRSLAQLLCLARAGPKDYRRAGDGIECFHVAPPSAKRLTLEAFEASADQRAIRIPETILAAVEEFFFLAHESYSIVPYFKH
jgi:hypothetical protein